MEARAISQEIVAGFGFLQPRAGKPRTQAEARSMLTRPRWSFAMRYRVLTAFFPGRSQIAGALTRLVECGVPMDAISVLPKNVNHLDDIGVRVATKAAEGAAVGALGGGVIGAICGAIAAAGALVIPGLDAVVAGPLVAALAGAGAVGGAGTILGALIGARVPEYEATYLDDAIHMGGSLLAVRCLADRAEGVEEILASSGGRAIHRSGPRAIGEE